MLQSSSGVWFVKLYPSVEKFRLQKRVINALHAEGFLQVPEFHPMHEEELIDIEGKAVGLTQWISSNALFTYSTFQERQEALSVLDRFHHASKNILPLDADLYLPRQNLFNKWHTRLEEFKTNKQKLSLYVPPSCIDSYINLGEQALEGVRKDNFPDDECILHGDLAHHNFLRNENKELYMIDFDLISSGPPIVDHIQFANRIFPYINWSLAALWKHKPLWRYREERQFLSALLYPSDVFREWNRFFRGGPAFQRKIWNYLIGLTLGSYHERMKCSREITSLLG